MSTRLDVSGRYGRLTAVREDTTPGLPRRHVWCRCDCGKEVSVRANSLRSGKTQSCGCLRDERRAEALTTHGMTHSVEYRTWRCIKERCRSEANIAFRHYGGRGIVMCDAWADSFEQFYADMGPRPSDDHSVERLDNDGPYSKENCIWATTVEQANNRRNNHIVTAFGETMTLVRAIEKWATPLGFSYAMVWWRLDIGHSVEDALTAPKNSLPRIPHRTKS